MNKKEFAKKIDSTLLRPDATEAEIRELCRIAREYGFATVALPSQYMKLALELLEGSGVGFDALRFPLGIQSTETKVHEAVEAVKLGCTEVDMVMALGKFKSGKYQEVEDEIRAVREAIPDVVLKVIIETHYLTDDEKRKAAELVANAGADFVKTSTGFAPTGATVEDIKLLYETVGDRIKVKASGGIRTTEQALALLEAGASRLGASNAHRLVDGLKEE